MNKNVKKNRVVTKKKKSKFSGMNLILIAAVAYFGVTFFNQQIKLNKYNSQIEMYNQEISSQNKLVEYYKNKKESISTDSYKESVAREKLGLVKPHEVIYIDANK